MTEPCSIPSMLRVISKFFYGNREMKGERTMNDRRRIDDEILVTDRRLIDDNSHEDHEAWTYCC